MNLYDRLMCKYFYDDFQQAVIRSFIFILPAPSFCLGFVFTPQKHTHGPLTCSNTHGLPLREIACYSPLSYLRTAFRLFVFLSGGKWLSVHQKVAHPAGPSNSCYTSAFPRSPFSEQSLVFNHLVFDENSGAAVKVSIFLIWQTRYFIISDGLK